MLVGQLPNARPYRLPKRQRDALITATANALQFGSPTLFALSADCRHGLRIVLVLHGWPWVISDLTSAAIVDRALRRLGARRPRWQEGQPDYVQHDALEFLRDRCARCGAPIVQDNRQRPRKFCSRRCANTHWTGKKNGINSEAHARAVSAAWLAKKMAQPLKPCAACGQLFHPTPATGKRPETVYCSPTCRNRAINASRRMAGKPLTRACAASTLLG